MKKEEIVNELSTIAKKAKIVENIVGKTIRYDMKEWNSKRDEILHKVGIKISNNNVTTINPKAPLFNWWETHIKFIKLRHADEAKLNQIINHNI